MLTSYPRRYLQILNLDHSHKVTPQFTMLCFVSPAGEANVQHLLELLVTDLAKMWGGEEYSLANGTKVTARAALLLVSCDSVARAKVSPSTPGPVSPVSCFSPLNPDQVTGMKSHAGKLGCGW